VVELAEKTRSFNIGQNPVVARDPQHDNEDWMRWNNLGIALYDQTQYMEAAEAFTEVTKLRPDYAEGFVNVGLTDYDWQRYEDADMAVKKALAINPNSARALYYMGLIDRRMSRNDAELAEFKRVVEMYPQSRDARRELGTTYYQQGDTKLALEQFQELEKIDPDDLAAHYNLAILYRRVGMKDKARQESIMFTTKKQDPGAPTYSLGFLRKHPEISTESIPWHMHTDLAPDGSQDGVQAEAPKSTHLSPTHVGGGR